MNNNSDDNNSDGEALQPFAAPPTFTDVKSAVKFLQQLQQQITSIITETEGPVVDFRIIHKLVVMVKHFQQVVNRIIDNESIKPEATEGLEQSLNDIISKVYKVGITQEKLEESTPEEIVKFAKDNTASSQLPHLLSAILNHSLSKGIICWSEDGKSFTVNITDRGRTGRKESAEQSQKKKDFKDLMMLFGLTSLTYNTWASQALVRYGFDKTNQMNENYSFRHACFDRYKPELLFRMISVQKGYANCSEGECKSCEQEKLLVYEYCASCAGENEANIPLANSIDKTGMAETKREILSKMKKHAATKSTVTKSSEVGPVMMLPEEVLNNPKMKWFLDTYGRKGDGSASNYPSYDEYESIVPHVTGKTRDELDVSTARVPSSQLIQHYSQYGRTKGLLKLHYRFTSSMIKYNCGGCYLCGAIYDPNKPNEMHFDHYLPIDREKYMLPSHAIHLSTDALRFQLPFTMLVCTRCHDFGTTRLWKLNKDYECVLSYPRKPMTISEVFNSQVFKDVEKLLLTADFLYGGIQPKISSEKLSYLLYKITGFVASDLVTYMNQPSEDEQEPDVWDKRPRLNMGSYIVTDILYNLTKKMQGECCGDNCGADIANEPPFKLSHFHGSHSEQGALNKGFNPTTLRNKGWKKGKEELLKLKGFECAGCHYAGSDDWGCWGLKNNKK